MPRERCACICTGNKYRFKCNRPYQITKAYIRGVMLAILLIGRANLNNSCEINASQLYNAVPRQVTYKTDNKLQNGVFIR